MVEGKPTNPWTDKDDPPLHVPILEKKDLEVKHPSFEFPDRVGHSLNGGGGGHGEPQDRAIRVFKVRGEAWSVDKQLMGGGFGMTYLATHESGSRYVIKFLKKADDPELDLLRSIPYAAYEHPNLCQYVGIFRSIEGKFPHVYDKNNDFPPKAMVCMHAIPNGELFDLISEAGKRLKARELRDPYRGPGGCIAGIGAGLAGIFAKKPACWVVGLSENTIRRFARDTIKGMRCLAKHHITHGDLKPENLLIDGQGSVVIIDLGCAKKHVSPLLFRLEKMTNKELKTHARCIGVEEDELDHANRNMAIMNLILDKVNTSFLAQLRAMRLGELKVKAREEGVEESIVESVDDHNDPNEKIIQLILRNKVTESVLAHLEEIPPKDLEMKASGDGIRKDVLAHAVAHAKSKQDTDQLAIMNLILERAIEPLEEKLKRMELGDLKERARKEGFGEKAIADVEAQVDSKKAMMKLILQVNTPLLAEIQNKSMTLGGLKTKAAEEGLDTSTVDNADSPKEKVIQLILDKRVSAKTSVFELLCTAGGTRTHIYSPPEWLCGTLYDSQRGDVFTVGLIFFMMKLFVSPENIRAGICKEGLKEELWDAAEKAGASFTKELKKLLNAMLRQDPKERPSWEELARACDEMSPREELKWLSLPVSEPLPFFQELKVLDSVKKHLQSSEAVEALLRYVEGFVEKDVQGSSSGKLSTLCDRSVQAFEAANTAHNGQLSTKELHEAMLQHARKKQKRMNASEMDVASLMCRFTNADTMELWDFETMCRHMSSMVHEVAPIVGRNQSRYYAWETCDPEEERECQKFVDTICAIGDVLTYKPWPEEARKKTLEDGLCHKCFSVEKETCQLQCNVFRMDAKVILESKRQWGSALEEWEMLGQIEAAIHSIWKQQTKAPVVLTEEWLLPAMQKTLADEVGEAQQKDGHHHVVLKDADGNNLTKVPNGEIVIILEEEGNSLKVQWTTIEGWAKKWNVVNRAKVQTQAGSRQACPSAFAKHDFDMTNDRGEKKGIVFQGERLQILTRKGDRVKVQLGASETWTNATCVTDQPPWRHGLSTTFGTKVAD